MFMLIFYTSMKNSHDFIHNNFMYSVYVMIAVDSVYVMIADDN